MSTEPQFCAYCGQPIAPEVLARRHYSAKKWPETICCNYAHSHAYRKESGQYAEMSRAGKEKRSRAVRESNKKHPRRNRASVGE